MRPAHLVLLSSLLASEALARDATRYPYDVEAYSGQYIQSILSRSTGAAVSLFGDSSFTDSQKTLLRRSLEIITERYVSPPVLDCAFESATKDFPSSREDFIAQMKEALGMKKVGEGNTPTYVFVARYSDEPESVGIGYQNLYYHQDKPFPGYRDRHFLYVAVNNDYFDQSGWFLGKNADYWAGVIAHEFLHNLNYNHAQGYSGSFIYEYGKCLWNNGVQANIPEGVFVDRTVEREM